MNQPFTYTTTNMCLSFAETFTFSAKEKDVETGFSYFGSRYYSSDLSIWLSVDPQASKYPSLSPYVYCANNPIKLMDPNGEDYETIINKDNKTITIKAIYYAKDSDKKNLQKGLDAWNSQSGKYTFTIENGENAGTYTINFELTMAESDGTSSPIDGISNSFEMVSDNIGGRGLTNDGRTIKVNNNAPDRTIIHEIGHTLGNGEFNRGVMLQGGNSDKILKENISTTLNQAGFHSLGNFCGSQITDPPSQSCNTFCNQTTNEPIYGIINRKR